MTKEVYLLGIIKEARSMGFSDEETLRHWNDILASPAGREEFEKLASDNSYPYSSSQLELISAFEKQAEAETLYLTYEN